jgi:hypothetical protein
VAIRTIDQPGVADVGVVVICGVATDADTDACPGDVLVVTPVVIEFGAGAEVDPGSDSTVPPRSTCVAANNTPPARAALSPSAAAITVERERRLASMSHTSSRFEPFSDRVAISQIRKPCVFAVRFLYYWHIAESTMASQHVGRRQHGSGERLQQRAVELPALPEQRNIKVHIADLNESAVG